MVVVICEDVSVCCIFMITWAQRFVVRVVGDGRQVFVTRREFPGDVSREGEELARLK